MSHLPTPTSFYVGNCSQSTSSLDLLAIISLGPPSTASYRTTPYTTTSYRATFYGITSYRITFHKQDAHRPKTKPVHHRLLALTSSASASCIASNRIALHGITSNIHTPLSVPTLAHPPASGFQTLPPLVHHDPINYRGRTLILPRCTTNRQSPCFVPCGRSSSCTCPPVSAAVGLAPGSRAARSSFCHPLRDVHHPPLERPIQTELYSLTAAGTGNGPSAHLFHRLLSNTPLSFNYGLYSAIRCQSFIYRVIKAGTPDTGPCLL